MSNTDSARSTAPTRFSKETLDTSKSSLRTARDFVHTASKTSGSIHKIQSIDFLKDEISSNPGGITSSSASPAQTRAESGIDGLQEAFKAQSLKNTIASASSSGSNGTCHDPTPRTSFTGSAAGSPLPFASRTGLSNPDVETNKSLEELSEGNSKQKSNAVRRRVSSHTRAIQKLHMRKADQQPLYEQAKLKRLSCIEGTFNSNVNGNQIYTCQWPPVQSPRALVFIAHGFGEHIGRYARHVERFTSRGIMVMGNDHQGHGRSKGDRGDIALFSTYAKDLVQFIETTVSTHKDTPVFIWGVGMGGAIAINIARFQLFDVRGCLFCGPLVMPDPRASTYFKRKLANALSYMAPKFNIGTVDPTMLCSSEYIVQQWRMDELNYHGTIRVRWANVTMKAAEENCVHLEQMVFPFICMQGMCDEIVIPEGASELFDRATCKDKTLIMFEGCGHEVHNEFSTSDVVDDMSKWLLDRLEASIDDKREEIVKFIPATVTHPNFSDPVDLDRL